MVRDSPGEGRKVTVTGTSLRRVVEAAGADLVGVGYAEVSVSGAPVLLSAGQITSTAGDGPVVIYEQSGGTAFLRPSAGEDDLNGRDQLAAPQITVRLHGGKLLEVKATASRRRAEARDPITFTASVPRSGSGQVLTYSWYFDDGSRERGRRVTHRFARAGNYDVVVGVTSEGDDAGASSVVRVRVGNPPKGPDRKGGGSNEAAGAPDSGAATGGSGAGSSGTGSGKPSAKRRATAPATAGGDRITGELLTESEPTPPQRAAGVAARSGRAEDGGRRRSARRGLGPDGHAGAGGRGRRARAASPPQEAWTGVNIEQLLFDVADALRYPVLAVALASLVWVLMEAGALVAELAQRRGRGVSRVEAGVELTREALAAGHEDRAVAAVRGLGYNAAMRDTLSAIVEHRDGKLASERIAKRLAEYDYRSLRRLERTRILVRLGPAVGLMGTLIPLSPALAGLARGDVEQLTNDLRVAFSVTVAGLLVGVVAFAISLVRDRLYSQDYSDVEYVSAALGPEAA